MTEKQCVGCRADMDADAIFCNECGMAQPAAVVAESAETVTYVSGGMATATFTKSCPSCGRKVEADVRFCPGCALDFSQSVPTQSSEPRCPGCQKLFSPDDRFCRHCATDLSNAAAVSSTAFCTRCGKSFDHGDKFCRFCSADISKSDHTVAVPIVTPNAASSPRIQITPTHVSNHFAPTSPSINTAPALTLPDERPLRNPSGPHWISPSAAAFVVVCFFLPWLEWSCFGARVPVSGAQLANSDPSFLLFPVAAIAAILVYFIFRSQKRLWKARPYIIGASAFGLFLLIYKVNTIPSAEFLGTRISASDLGFSPQIGSIGTVAGYIVAIIGCAFMTRITSGGKPSNTGVGGGGPGWYREGSRPTSFMARIVSLRSNKAAMLCYLTPLIGPFIVQFLAASLIGLLGAGVLLLTLAAVSMFVLAQIVFLKLEPHRADSFVRFHAFQSLFLIAATIGSILISIGLLSVAPSLGPIVTLLVYSASIGYLIAAIFLAVRSNRGEPYKLPVIGDWAAGYAQPSPNATDFSIR